MLLNEVRQLINEVGDEVSISNPIIVFNEAEQSASKAVMPLNSDESISNKATNYR